MSSLRISHQNRAIGATAGGDAARSEHADNGASFAVALGTAASLVPKDAAVRLGGKSGDASDGSAAPRKRADNSGKPADVASVAASVAGSLIAAPVVAEAAASAGAGGDFAVAGRAVSASAATDDALSDDATTLGAATVGALTDDVTTLGAATVGAFTDGITTLGAATVGALSSAPLVAAGSLNGSTSAVAGKKAIVASDAVASEGVHGANSVPAVTEPRVPAAATIGAPIPASQFTWASAPTPADRAAGDQPPSGQAQPATVDPASFAAPSVPASQSVAPAPMPAAAAHFAGNAAPGTLDAATIGVTSGASGVASGLPLAIPNGPSPGGVNAVAGAATAAPAALPPVAAGQAAVANGGDGFGFAPRDRFAPAATQQNPGNVFAAAAATVANGTAPAPASSAAAPTLGGGLDPAGAGTIADQIGGELARMVSNGSREMVLRLHPPELGDLTVRIAVSGRDVSAWFASPQPQVQSAISAAIGQLQTNLGNAGYNLNGAWVGGDASGGRQQQAALPASPGIGAPLAAASALPATAVSRSASSGLNIYV